ncbi:MAG: SOS response-associated peptidase [Methylocystaceae bacterium]|nr:SOS response-associated peptidase [Methylocystaceae bacterium]
MCANFEALYPLVLLQEYFALSVLPKETSTNKSVRPTDEPVVISSKAHALSMYWGLKTAWSDKPLINARTETLFEKPTFQTLYNNRCLVPASAWFEWRKDDGEKYKNRISIKNNPLFAMAAIYQNNRFCILTCPANDQVTHIHHRMPVILKPDDYQDWLDPNIETQQLVNLFSQPNDFTFDWQEDVPAQVQLKLF